MIKKIAKQWIKALRSGDYKQCETYFRVDHEFCVLGVLCDLHSKETGCEWEATSSGPAGLYSSNYFAGNPYTKIIERFFQKKLENGLE